MGTIVVVVGAVIWILLSFSLSFLQVGGDVALAALAAEPLAEPLAAEPLIQVAVGPTHVDEAKECHRHRD